MTDAEIDAFVASTLDLPTAGFLIEVAKLVHTKRTGWTLKAAAQLVRRAAKDHGWVPTPSQPEEVSL